jgi:hypothetical protein
MPTASAAPNATTPHQNTASEICGRSAGLKTRSVPMRASKYSLKASTPTTDSTTPERPVQNAAASNVLATPQAHAAPSR